MEPDEAPDLLTMESELDRVERWVVGADSANPLPYPNTPDRRHVSDNHVLAMVSEIRRLRAVVRSARIEGARLALEAAKASAIARAKRFPHWCLTHTQIVTWLMTLSPEDIVREAEAKEVDR